MVFHNVRGPDGKFVSKTGRSIPAKATKKVNVKLDSLGRPIPPRDANGKFIKTGASPSKNKPAQSTKVKPPVIQTVNPDLVTHVSFLIDESGSMQSYTQAAIDSFNKQLGAVKVESNLKKLNTKVSVTKFGTQYGYEPSTGIMILATESFPEAVRPFDHTTYRPRGGTPLYNAMIQLLESHRLSPDFYNKDHSYLFVIITDGANTEQANEGHLSTLIKQALGTDRYTFAVSAPDMRSVDKLVAFGIPPACVQIWEGSERGVAEMTKGNTLGISNYMSARSVGSSKVDKFYTDLSTLTNTEVSKLQDLTSNFKSKKVDKEVDITTFFTNSGKTYSPGTGYYELTKPEVVQSHKAIVIQDRSTGKVYGGDKVRDTLGLPMNVDAKVVPGNHANWKIFVQSTSGNRKLVRGTTVLHAS
jgi:hypothetical protein